jgi:hypothetical protein
MERRVLKSSSHKQMKNLTPENFIPKHEQAGIPGRLLGFLVRFQSS